ncbi:MAG: TauD/TfdA family dioxygenase [Proteobacteria bacterium]|nr:TauD/TfdA family dioxygenase [Pseudomonadota bacterium]
MPDASPFDLGNPAGYAAWRDRKLAAAPTTLAELLVEIDDPRNLSGAERNAVLERVRRANMAIYASNTAGQADTEIPRRLGRQLGLVNLDQHYLADDEGISALTVAEGGTHAEFIPYTDRAIKWHTDGYYNPPDRTVSGMLLHCVQPAMSGGDNQLLDHEIAYILLRDSDPGFVRALSAPDAMTIPARVEADGEARPAQSGPVFSVDAGENLHMRYTARRISILWKDDAATAAAVAALEDILARETPWTLRGRLEAGMGLICNNVLHDRSAFRNEGDRQRLLYRARYYERINGRG